jgi:biotin carboxyl carrier protein
MKWMRCGSFSNGFQRRNPRSAPINPRKAGKPNPNQRATWLPVSSTNTDTAASTLSRCVTIKEPSACSVCSTVNPNFSATTSAKTVSILANQTTVAIRNAQLYQQVPLAGFLKPLAVKRQQFFGAGAQSRWFEYGWKAALAALVLTIVPWPVRVSTNATVVPADRRVISAVAGGIVRRVFVHEGDVVVRGQTLAQLDDGEDRVKLERAKTDLGARATRFRGS